MDSPGLCFSGYFNGNTTFNNNSANAIWVAHVSAGNQFNGNVTYNNLGTGSIYNYFGGTATVAFNGNIVVNNTSSTGGVYFGAIAGSSGILATTKTISIGGTGFGTGTLYLSYLTQSGTTAQGLSLTGTGLLQIGPAATFNGNVNFVAPQVILNGSTFNGTALIQKSGATQNNSLGGNVFNGATTITNSGSGHLVLGFPTGVDIFNGDLSLVNTGTAGLYPAYNTAGHQFNGNISLHQTTGTGIFFCAGTGTATLATGKTLSTASGFSGGALNFARFTQLGATAQTFTLTGTSLLQMGPSVVFNGNVNFTTPQVLLNGATFNGTASLTKSGATDNVSTGGNIFNGVTTLLNSGSGSLDLGSTLPETFNTHLTINNTGTSRTQIGISSVGNLFNGNLTINYGGNTTGLNVVIARNAGATATINGNLTLNCTNLNATSGIIISNDAAVTINGNVTVSSTSGRGVLFGAASGTVTLANGFTIADGRRRHFYYGNFNIKQIYSNRRYGPEYRPHWNR